MEGEIEEIIDEENEGNERTEEEQEREDQEMMEGHQRNHIGIIVLGVQLPTYSKLDKKGMWLNTSIDKENIETKYLYSFFLFN